MRAVKNILAIAALLYALPAAGQRLPNQFPQKANAEGTDELYTQASGTAYRIILDSVRMFMAPDIDLVALGYEIDSTGLNVVDSLRGRFVIDASGDWWYVDKDKNAVAVSGGGGAGTDDQTAAEVPITDAGAHYAGTDVEAALQEVGDSLATHRTAIDTKVDGSGTMNALAKFTPDGNTIGNADITAGATSIDLGAGTDTTDLNSTQNIIRNVVTVPGYPNSRDDSGSTTPLRPLYTSGTGSLRVAPLGDYDLESNPFGGDTRLQGNLDSLYAASQAVYDSLGAKPVVGLDLTTPIHLPDCATSGTFTFYGTLIDPTVNAGDDLTGILTETGEASLAVVGIYEVDGGAMFEVAGNLAAGSYTPEITYNSVVMWSGLLDIVAGVSDTVTVFDPPGQDSILVTRVCGVEVSRDTIRTPGAVAGDGNGIMSALPAGDVVIIANDNGLKIDELDSLIFDTGLPTGVGLKMDHTNRLAQLGDYNQRSTGLFLEIDQLNLWSKLGDIGGASSGTLLTVDDLESKILLNADAGTTISGTGYSIPMPTSSPSTTLNDTTMMAWRGTGAAATPLFIPKPPGSGAGSVSDGDKGDIDVSLGGTTWTIDTNSVDRGKIDPKAIHDNFDWLKWAETRSNNIGDSVLYQYKNNDTIDIMYRLNNTQAVSYTMRKRDDFRKLFSVHISEPELWTNKDSTQGTWGGTSLISGALGAKIFLTFSGTGVLINYYSDPNRGKIQFVLDGGGNPGDTIVVDGYDASTVAYKRASLWENLPYGTHSVVGEVIAKNPLSGGNNFSLWNHIPPGAVTLRDNYNFIVKTFDSPTGKVDTDTIMRDGATTEFAFTVKPLTCPACVSEWIPYHGINTALFTGDSIKVYVDGRLGVAVQDDAAPYRSARKLIITQELYGYHKDSVGIAGRELAHIETSHVFQKTRADVRADIEWLRPTVVTGYSFMMPLHNAFFDTLVTDQFQKLQTDTLATYEENLTTEYGPVKSLAGTSLSQPFTLIGKIHNDQTLLPDNDNQRNPPQFLYHQVDGGQKYYTNVYNGDTVQTGEKIHIDFSFFVLYTDTASYSISSNASTRGTLNETVSTAFTPNSGSWKRIASLTSAALSGYSATDSTLTFSGPTTHWARVEYSGSVKLAPSGAGTYQLRFTMFDNTTELAATESKVQVVADAAETWIIPISGHYITQVISGHVFSLKVRGDASANPEINNLQISVTAL